MQLAEEPRQVQNVPRLIRRSDNRTINPTVLLPDEPSLKVVELILPESSTML